MKSVIAEQQDVAMQASAMDGKRVAEALKTPWQSRSLDRHFRKEGVNVQQWAFKRL